MTLEDVPAVVQIEKDCFSQPWSEQSFCESITREDTIFLVYELTEEDDISFLSNTEEVSANTCALATKVVAYIGMYLSFDEASITNVAVSPSYRKRGIGEQLVAEAKQSAKAAGAVQMLLEVRVSNEAAIVLYEKQHFSSLGIRKKFYQHPIEDAYIMSCDLTALE